MESPQRTPDDIQRQMSAIRTHLGGEVDGIVSNAQHLADWKHYVRAFPWASLGVAAAVGYFAVPRKLQIVSPDKETLAQLAKENRLVVEHSPKGTEKPGIVGSLVNLAGNMALRAGIAYAGQQAGKIFGHEAAEQTSPQGVSDA